MKYPSAILGDLLEANPRFEKGDKPSEEELVSFVPMSSVSEKTLSITETIDRPYHEVRKGFTPFKTGDVLIAKITPCFENGKMALVENLPRELGFGSTEFHVFRPGKRIFPRYLFHLLRSPFVRASGKLKMKGAAGQRRVPVDFFTRLTIPLPPLAEQKRIAAILDAADELRAKRREAIAQLDVFLQSTFIEMFGDPVTNPKGWPVVNFEDAVYFQEGPGIRKWQFRNKGIKLVNIRNIVDGELVLTNTEKYLDPDEVSRTYSHFLLDAGDLVMSSSGVTWGKIAYVKQQHLPLSLNTSMIRLRPQGGRITHAFIRAFVESQAFRRQISRLITGSAQPNFGPSHLRKIVINLPPIDIQSHFEEIVASIEHQKSLLNVHLAELDTLFASLQHRAFNGEL
ncbi:hypothetical protein HaloA020_11250 [Halomonas sp. A020]|uniref:restriction endonuclease subunit S n=1 Tax=Halomonas sp. A020 TaxID=2717374 RepID=UPI00249382B0|nr:restriction endonuclease subunit S [Halomonas sp. A020]BCB60424.1 hypothetical protein HaloA020_11250 [Halomonas sp. A020]